MFQVFCYLKQIVTWIMELSLFKPLYFLKFIKKNCIDLQFVADPKTRVIEMTTFDVSPKPLVLPGTATVTIIGNIAHQLAVNSHYRLNVTMDKKLLGHWHAVPCAKKVGTW